MASRTINSPGVELREQDLSLIAPQNVGTNIFIAGFASQGYCDEVIKITSKEELDNVYGYPTNSAEKYFYHGIKELLASPANIYTYRLPYGESTGNGFGSKYSALAYPVKSYSGTATNSVSSFEITLNYSPTLSGRPLSGAAFKIQTSNGSAKTVVFNIDGVGAVRLGDVTVAVASNANFSTITSAITAQLNTSLAGQFTFSTSANSVTVKLSGYVPLLTGVPATSASVLPGLDDDGDIFSVNPTLSTIVVGNGVSDSLDFTEGSYFLGEPVHYELNDTEYRELVDGSLFNWSDTGCNRVGLSSIPALGKAGLIVVNKSQTTINPQFEGYYVGIADNTNLNPNTPNNSVLSLKTVSTSEDVLDSYTPVPNGTLQFNLSSNVGNGTSVSYVLETLTDYNIDGREDDDVLSIGVFKVRKSIYATESFKLDYIVDGAIVGSVDSHRQQLNPTGGPNVSFFLENKDENDRNVTVLVNPYLSNKYSNTSLNLSGQPTKKVRMYTNALVALTGANDLTVTGIPASEYSKLSGLGFGDNLYALGAYSDNKFSSKALGSIPSKVSRALESVINDEIYDIDVVVEAGIGTIFTATSGASGVNYDDTLKFNAISSIQKSNELDEDGKDIRTLYTTIFNLYENFCNLPSNSGGRGDCIFIADILRHVVVNGNSKVLADKSKSFQQYAYWPIRHQFEMANTSYACVYANWSKIYDEFSGGYIWVPFSPVAAAAFARSDAAEFPWSAPAGYTRGLVGGYTVDLAITPNQKQRDELYKANINPVLFSPSQGMAIFGQKTLSKKPSAFDRINVRRLFFALERPSKKASIFFVFEPNTEFTRTRLLNTLEPVFKYAKDNGGLYDFELVCDSRNNGPEVIDSNELHFSAYLKPTKTAEFIILNFIATRTDANFEELF